MLCGTRKTSGTYVKALLACSLMWLTACVEPPEIVGIDNPETPVLSLDTTSRHRVFIATTRADTEVVGALFSELRAEELGLASVDVSIPPNHVVGALERPKSLPPDPLTEFAIVAPTVYAQDSAFVAALDAELNARAATDRDILFFVHGYNMTTSEAIMRVGQFVEDSDFRGVPVLFTWASAGKTSRYVYDLNSALIARTGLIEAAAVIAQAQAREYHVFAHSMGAFLTMEAIVYASLTDSFDRRGRLRDVILASPDIDLDLFRAQLSQIDDSFEEFHVLLSKDDYALRASRLLAGGVPRVGAADVEELAALGVNAIDLSQITDSNADSHNKFAGSPEVVQLIGLGLNSIPRYGDSRRTLLEQFVGNLPIKVVGGG